MNDTIGLVGERFESNRFANAAVDRPHHAYLPFGNGARTFIGKTFATIETVLILATLMRRWRLRIVPNHRVALKTRPTLMPKFGMRMIVL